MIPSPEMRRRARNASAESYKLLNATKARSVKPSSGMKSRTFHANKPKPTSNAAAAGQVKLRFRLSQEARRQAIIGPTAIKKTRNKKSGTVTELKYGAPTLT